MSGFNDKSQLLVVKYILYPLKILQAEPPLSGVRVTIPDESLAYLTPQTFGTFKLINKTFGLGQSNIAFQSTISNRKADILTTRLKIKDIL